MKITDLRATTVTAPLEGGKFKYEDGTIAVPRIGV